MFELVGVLVHSGTAESGHYYSYAKERVVDGEDDEDDDGDRWFEFNDEIVKQWSLSNLENCAFGGLEQRPTHGVGNTSCSKPYSAYMLFYQRIPVLKGGQRQTTTQADQVMTLRDELDPDLRRYIGQENHVLLRRYCLYDPVHVKFVMDCFGRAAELAVHHYESQSGIEADADLAASQAVVQKMKLEAMQAALAHFDQVVTRTQRTPQLEAFTAMIESAVEDDSEYAAYFCEHFNLHRGSYQALVQKNPEKRVRQYAGRLLIVATQQLANNAPERYYPSVSAISSSDEEIDEDQRSDHTAQALDQTTSCIMAGITDIFGGFWKDFHRYPRSWPEHLGALIAFARQGDREVSMLLSRDCIQALVNTIRTSVPSSSYDQSASTVPVRSWGEIRRGVRYDTVLEAIAFLLGKLDARITAERIVEEPQERLEQDCAPFCWSSSEINCFSAQNSLREPISPFTEQSILLSQATGVTNKIIARLIRTGSIMEKSILNTLCNNMNEPATEALLTPFLRASATFMRYASDMENIQRLIHHVVAHAEYLHDDEAATFLGVLNAAMDASSDGTDGYEPVSDAAIASIPRWAPYLIAFPAQGVREGVRKFIRTHLFPPHPEKFFDAAEQAVVDEEEAKKDGGERAAKRYDKENKLIEVRKSLWTACIHYLRKAHIVTGTPIYQSALIAYSDLLLQCIEFMRMKNDTSSGMSQNKVKELDEWSRTGAKDMFGILQIGEQETFLPMIRSGGFRRTNSFCI